MGTGEEAMKMRIQRADGRVETLSLVPPVEAHFGTTMWRLHCADGTDHFFLEDGHYDGWRRECLPPLETMEQAAHEIHSNLSPSDGNEAASSESPTERRSVYSMIEV